MSAVTASMVNELRRRTGVGMMDCKKALVACGGDADAAVDYLRKAGMAKAAKKAGRSATEGRFAVLAKGDATALVEVLCETDFVAKTREFTDFAQATCARALDGFDKDGDVSAELAALVAEDLKVMIGKLGENMHVRRAYRWTAAAGGRIGTYLHTGVPYGCMVEVEGECSDELLNSICLHITANNPAYIAPADIPGTVLEHEREIARAQVKDKPARIIDNIIKGKMNKMYSEVCLMNQPWIDDDKTCLAKVAPKLKVKRFLRLLVGEELPGEKTPEEA